MLHPGGATRLIRTHETATHAFIARRLARILNYRYAGNYDSAAAYPERLYFVPGDTLTLDVAAHLGVRTKHGLFGGAVPFPFVATKLITHPLLDPKATAPAGWSVELAVQLRAAVLPGYSVFTLEDARGAALRLLAQGPLRLKPAYGVGGRGQATAATVSDVDALLQKLDAQALLDGLVVESDLTEVTTYGVGRVHVGGLVASYCGTQKLTANNSGEMVYGGSEFTVVRGDFDALEPLPWSRNARLAIKQARHYHEAAFTAFPGMFASRCNYDVAQGFDADGRWCSGVLEQSWRIGGGSGAEVAALEAFKADPDLHVVRASTTEVYGANITVPAGALVHYRGVDEHIGAITKYSQLERHADTR